MTHTTTHRWECDTCGKVAELVIGSESPEGWQYVWQDDGDARHACSRDCARTILLGDVEAKLDYWYPPVPAEAAR